MARTFAGGVRPAYLPGRGARREIREIGPPPRVVLPLSQHAGSPARPAVSVGDHVRAGARIAEADGFVSAPVHASVTGRVTAIGLFPHPIGRPMPAIEIQTDSPEEVVAVDSWRDLSAASPSEIREAVRAAGVVGLGGAAFPTEVKLTPPDGVLIDTVIANAAECEPGLSADHSLMLDQPEAIVEGLVIVMRAVGAERGLIGIEADKRDAWRGLKKAIGPSPNIKMVELEVRYPQGAEKVLIKSLVRREVPRGGLPLHVGCLVHNVATCYAVRQAVKQGLPLVTRVVTLAGKAAAKPGNFRVRLGTPVSHLVQAAGGTAGECRRIVLGGPMMGVAQPTADVPVIKGTTGVFLMRDRELPAAAGGPCIRCGRCVERCPVGLMPNDLARFVQRERLDRAADYGVCDCIECGVCAYVCPAKIDLVRWMRSGKTALAKVNG